MPDPELTTDSPVNTDATPSMDDTIRDAFREIEAREDAPETSADAPARSRDASGRFAKAEAPEQTEQPVIEKKAWDDFPVSWEKDLAEQWTGLPEAVRQRIYKREDDFHKGLGEYREAAAVGRAFWQEISPHIGLMRQVNATPQAVVHDLLQTWQALVTGNEAQRREVLLRIASQAGIDITGADASATTDSASAAPDRVVLQRLADLERSTRQIEADRQQAEFNEHLRSVTAFQADARNEHFGLVADEMLRMLQSGYATSLQDAYDKACRVSEAVQAKRAEKAAKEQAQKDAERAAAAKKAAAVNVARRGTVPTAPAKGSIEDTIRQTYRQLQG